MPDRVFEEFTPAGDWAGRQEAGTVWIAEIYGRPEAFLAATGHGDRLHIDEFAVAYAHQGKGLGRRLLRTVIDWAHDRGLADVSLTTFRNVAFNGPFYASAGFAFWADPSPELEAILAAEAARGLMDRCAMRLRL